MLLRHLALAVTDEARSQAFYAGWFGFGESRRMDDGVLMLYGPGDVSLALGPAEGPPSLPAFLHFGFVLESPEAVRESRDAFAAARRDRRLLGRARLRQRQGPRPRRLRRRGGVGAERGEAVTQALEG
jgi:catechol 2,3-dioxygenase-like lactoylglutathione lyase family enzyme